MKKSLVYKELEKTELELKKKNEELQAINEKLTVTNKTLKEKEERIRESEEKFHSLAAIFPGAIVLTDTQGIILEMNKAFACIFGYEQEEMLGKSYLEFLPGPDIRSRTVQMFRDLQKTGNVPPQEITIITKEGKHIQAKQNVAILKNDSGAITHFIAVIHEIIKHKHVEEALQQERDKAQTYLDLAGIMFVAINKEGEVTLINKKGCKILGYNDKDIIGKNWFDNFIPEKLRDVVKHVSKKLLAGELEQAEYSENPVLIRNGEERIIAWHNTILRDKSGNIIGHLSSGEDITDHKKAEELLRKNEALYRGLYINAPLGVCTFKKDGKILDANQEFADILGSPSLELTKSINVMQLTLLIEAGIVDDFEKCFKTGKKISFTRYYTSKLGKRTYLRYHLAPIFDRKNNVILVHALFEDCTQRKKLEEELIKTRKKAEESDLLKSAFLANMSHEIRTPINGIIGFSSLLKKPNLPVEKTEQYINMINKNSKRLLTIIDDVIDISKIEADQIKIEPEKCYLNDLMYKLCDNYKSEIKSKRKNDVKISVDLAFDDEESYINIDESRLLQILSNLINNALKFTEKGNIEMGYLLENKNTLKFYVKDTGIGISKDKQEIIFERFRQAEIDHIKLYGGTGLGLTICKRLVELMGGEIRVESEEGKGSAFYFTLPYQPVKKAEAKNPPESLNYNLEGKKILIVEDELSSLQLLEAIIADLKIQKIHAENGQKAVEICKEDPDIDLVLMNIEMPVMNGYEATREIKKIREDLPVIAQSAHALTGDKQKCIQAGCDDYISKPIDIDILITMMHKYLGKK